MQLFQSSVGYYTIPRHAVYFFFFFNDTATTEIYTLSLHDALPISRTRERSSTGPSPAATRCCSSPTRSEEHTSELQSPCNLVCRLLLEKKKNISSQVHLTALAGR